MRLCIEREGEFPVGWTHSNHKQCGNVGTPILQFRVAIECDHEALTPEGWIIDNNAIPSYFREKYERVKDFQSCEHIAATAVEELFHNCKLAGSRPCSVRVSVTGIPGSWITAHKRTDQ